MGNYPSRAGWTFGITIHGAKQNGYRINTFQRHDINMSGVHVRHKTNFTSRFDKNLEFPLEKLISISYSEATNMPAMPSQRQFPLHGSAESQVVLANDQPNRIHPSDGQHLSYRCGK